MNRIVKIALGGAVTLAIACYPADLPPLAGRYADPDAYRGALDIYHATAPDAAREECGAVMRATLWSITEMPGQDFAPGARTDWVRERTLTHIRAKYDGWLGASVAHLEAFEQACDANLSDGIPVGPGEVG